LHRTCGSTNEAKPSDESMSRLFRKGVGAGSWDQLRPPLRSLTDGTDPMGPSTDSVLEGKGIPSRAQCWRRRPPINRPAQADVTSRVQQAGACNAVCSKSGAQEQVEQVDFWSENLGTGLAVGGAGLLVGSLFRNRSLWCCPGRVRLRRRSLPDFSPWKA